MKESEEDCMRLFIVVIFCFFIFDVINRIFSIISGDYLKPRKLGIYAADGLINAFICIWAGFLIWY